MCSSNQIANSVQEAENLLKKHHELSDEISQIYAEVDQTNNFFLYFFVSLISYSLDLYFKCKQFRFVMLVQAFNSYL